jgi:exo-beta-1,3-glucanase (GH17 family)
MRLEKMNIDPHYVSELIVELGEQGQSAGSASRKGPQCPLDSELIDKVRGQVRDLDRAQELDSHLLECEGCQRTVVAYQRIVGDPDFLTSLDARPSLVKRIAWSFLSAWNWVKVKLALGSMAATAGVWGLFFLVLFLWLRDSELAALNWWALVQGQLFVSGIVLGFLIALGAYGLQRAGWVSRTRCVPVASLAMSVLLLFLSSGGAEVKKSMIRNDLNAFFLGHRWVTYEPPSYDPINAKDKMPSLEAMQEDLRRLHDSKEGGGFDGLITFHAIGTMAEIPRLAKEIGFTAVIMGIHVEKGEDGRPVEPTDQIDRAIRAAPWVDAYCLGHNTPYQLDLNTLAGWMARLRRATGKPVTTTLPLNNYLGERGKKVREMGDFYFVDVHGSWHDKATPGEILKELNNDLIYVTQLPRDKPVLLKMISYPSSGGEGLTEENQARFFKGVCTNLYLPPGVGISVFSGYDLPWKGSPYFSESEAHTGLFKADGTPKKAVEVLRNGFPIQDRP